MRASAFEVAGVHLHFTGEPSDIEILKRLFEKFPPPRGQRPDVSVALDCKRCSWKTKHSSGSIRLLDPRAATAAATMLLARLLSEVRPEFVILHGNGLRHPDGHPLLIMGDSGAGKTTLTRQLLQAEFGCSQIAEDVLVLDPVDSVLHPFPRALAIRTAEDTPGAEATFGFADETRQGRPLEAFAAEAMATPLRDASVFLLARAADEPRGETRVQETGPARGERAWVSWADEQTKPALESAGLPVTRLEIGSSVAIIDYGRALTNEERALQHRLFETLEIMHLHSAPLPASRGWAENPVEPAAPAGTYRRPESPMCELMEPGEGIRGCLAHLRRVTGVQSPGEASRVFLRLAKALSSARFHRLVPGGTPHQTAILLSHNAGGASKPGREVAPV
jgi:hypothetical protein